MTSEIGTWHDIMALDDLPSGEMVAKEIAGHQVALYNVASTIYATDNICSHAYALLTDGWLEGDVIECPLHGGQFNVCTGKAVCAPADADIRVYPVRVSDGRIEILHPV